MNAMLLLPNSDDAPLLGNGPADAAMAEAMVERLREAGDRSTAEMLEELRRAFPNSPLALRVRALAALNRRPLHMPR